MTSVAPAVAPPTRRKTPARRSWQSRLLNRRVLALWSLRLVLTAIFIVAWQLAPANVVPASAVGRPGGVVSSIGHLITSGQIFSALGNTALAIAYSIVIGGVAGALLAIVSSLPVVRWFLQPIISVAYSIPKVALITLYILLLGVSVRTHVVFVVTAVIFIYYFAIHQSLAELDQSRLTALRLMGASWTKVLTSFILPSSVPQLFAATRIALPLAFTSEIFAELRVPTSSGLGVLLNTDATNLDGASSMAMLLVITLIAYLLDVFLRGRLQNFTESTGVGFQV
jgi:ABC-type nitrate/sulfonate/bicarbonate transport system permease component